jgi:plastocyanin
MGKNIVYIIIAVLILGGAGFLIFNQGKSDQRVLGSENGNLNNQVNIPGSSVGGSSQVIGATGDIVPASGTVETKSFIVEGSSYKFVPNEITVKKGDTVQITFKNLEGMHDFVIDEFNARTKRIKTGESESISFIASKAGTFEFYCSVGSHRAMGMKGNLVVTE